MKRLTLSIVVVNYNTKNLLKQCIESIKKSIEKSASRDRNRKVLKRIEIIIVDNNSTDGSVEFIKSLTSLRVNELRKKKKKKKKNSLITNSLINNRKISIKLIENKKNLGFAKANNQGIKAAQGEYILLLNSDTIVLPGSLEKLVEFAQSRPDAGVIAPKLLNSDKTIQPSCYHFPSIWGAVKEFWLGQQGAFSKYAPSSNRPVVVDAVVGAAFLIPRKVIEKVGLLDERYFMYFEDLDYCRRVWRSGYKVYYLPEAKIIHLHGASGKKMGNQPNRWLIKSSKIYYGAWRYWLITAIIRLSQIWKKLQSR